MPLDALAPDQRAVVQLVLQRGRSYAEIAELLKISEDAVRARAHAGLSALAPEVELPADKVAQIADYLLSQQNGRPRQATRRLLRQSNGAREWATAVRAELEDVAETLPEIPSPSGAKPAARDAAPAGAKPAAEAAPSEDEPAAGGAAPSEDKAAAEATPSEDKPAAGGAAPTGAKPAVEEVPSADTPAAAEAASSEDKPAAGGVAPTGAKPAVEEVPSEDTPAAAEAAPSEDRPAPRPRPRRAREAPVAEGAPAAAAASSRLGGAVLIGGVVLALVALLLWIFVFTGDDDEPSGAAASPTATPAATPQAVGQIEMRGTDSASRARGLMRLFASQGQLAFTIEGTNVPQSRENEAYAVWFVNPGGGAQRLGYAPPVGEDGRLGTTGPREEDLRKFPDWLARYRQVVVSRDRSQSAKSPGPIVLRGTLPRGTR